LRKFEGKLTDSKRDDKFYLVNVISDREVSNAIAKKFQIIHQSPQVLVIKNEKVLAYASHYDILEINL
jgi:bacillithiol system protein YtxJ